MNYICHYLCPCESPPTANTGLGHLAGFDQWNVSIGEAGEASEALEHLCLRFWNVPSWNPAAMLKGILGYLDVEGKPRGKIQEDDLPHGKKKGQHRVELRFPN